MSNVARLSNDGVLSSSTFDDSTRSPLNPTFSISSNATAYSHEFKEPQVSVINTISNSTKTDPLTLTGINPGNLVFYVASCDSAESHDFTVPTGFSEVTIVNSSGPNYIIASKISDGTSVTAQNMTFPSGATAQFMFAVSGVDTLQSQEEASSNSTGMPGGIWQKDESKVGSYLFSFGFLDDDIVASSVSVENFLEYGTGNYTNDIFVGAADAGTSGAGSTLMVAFSKVKNDGGSLGAFGFSGDGNDNNSLRRFYYIATPLRQNSDGSSEVGKIIDETEVFGSIRPQHLELHYNSELSKYLFPASISLAGYREFTSTGTFTVPAGVSSVNVIALGGGGGGGHNDPSAFGQNTGAGGGGGGMCISNISVTGGESLTVTVGSGGSAGGGDGGDSRVLRSGTLLVEGGGGSGGGTGTSGGGAGGIGNNPSGSGAAASIQLTGGNGGNGTVGVFLAAGKGGGGGGGAAGAGASGPGDSGSNGGDGGDTNAIGSSDGNSSSFGGGGGGGGTQTGSFPNITNGGGGGGGGFKNRRVEFNAGIAASSNSCAALLLLTTAEVLDSTFSINDVQSIIDDNPAATLTSGTVVNCSFWSGQPSISTGSSLDSSPYVVSGTGGTNLGTGQFTSDANGNLTLTSGSLPTSAVKSIVLQKTQASPSEQFVTSMWKVFDGSTSGGAGGSQGYGGSAGGGGLDGDDGSDASTINGGDGGNYGGGGGGGGGSTGSTGENNGGAGAPGYVAFSWSGSTVDFFWEDISGNDRDLTLPFAFQSGSSSSFQVGSGGAGVRSYQGFKVQFTPKLLPGQNIKIKDVGTGGGSTATINHVRGDIYYTLGSVSNGGNTSGWSTVVSSDTNFYSDITIDPTGGNTVTNLYRKEVISSYQDFYESPDLSARWDLVLRGNKEEANALLYIQRGFANVNNNSYSSNGLRYMTAPFYGDGAGVVNGDSGNAYTGVTGTSARTIIFSVKPTSQATDSRPFSYGANSTGQRFTCRITTNNKFRVEIGGGYVETTNAVNLTYKNMFAVTCPDSGTVADIKIWINGKEITSLTTSNPTLAINTSSANNVSIGGAEHETNEAYLIGVIDNVMIYSAALNDLEIKNIYNSVVKLLSPFTEDYVGVAGSAPTIITDNLELHLDALNSSSYSGSGTTWSDLSGNGNNGTITNSSEVVYNSSGWFDWTDGPVFDSTGGYVSLPNTAITLGSTYTIEIWNYYDSTSAPAQAPWQGGNLWTNSAESDWSSGAGNNNGLLFGYNSIVYRNTSGTEVEVDYSTNPTTQVWHQHVLVVNSGSGTVYVDKTSVGTMSNMRTLGQSNGTLGIGVGDFVSNYRGEYLGFISIVRVYPGKALSVSEITQNFNVNKDRYGI